MPAPTPALHVAIAGGGIGGLAAAAFLHRAGLGVTVCEQAPVLREVGAGLVLAPNAIRLLTRLGLRERLAAAGVRLEAGWEFRRWEDGRVLFSQRLGDECVRRFGEGTWVMHRADLLGMLLSAVPSGAVRLGQRVTGARQDGSQAVLELADGGAVHADVAVAADGVHSVLRGEVTEPSLPHHCGVSAWRSLIPAAAAPALMRRPVQTLWLGPGRHLVHYPVSAGQLINVVAFAPASASDVESWAAVGDPDDFRAEFAGWDPRLGDLLAALTRVGRWAVLDRDPLATWTRGRLALAGDAAHPMVPFYAQGAGQAIEDAAVLAACLAGDTADPVAALRRYEQVRAPRASRIQQLSHGRLEHNHLPDGPAQRARDAAFAAEDPLSHNGWMYSYDAEAAVV
ncbi:MAG: FAD-dependent monooxygenase [Gemmatimonadota bacterium]